MYENAGGKIKTLSIIVFWVGIIFSILSLIMWLGVSEEVTWQYETACEVAAVVSLVVGVFASWAISILINGFGELIEKTTEIAKNTRKVSRSGTGWHSENSRSSYLGDIEANLPDM